MAAARLVIIYAAVAVIGMIAVVATARLGVMVDAAWAGIGSTTGVRGIALAVLCLGLVIAAVAVVRRVPDDGLRRWVPMAPLLLLIAVRAIAIPLVDTPISADNDPRYLHELAVGVLDGGNPLVAHRPMAFSTMLAGLYALFGVHPWLGELLNLGLAVLTGWMLHRVVLNAWGARPAAAALVVYALVPSQVLLTTTLFTETAYAAVLMTAIMLATGAVATGRIVAALATGAILAASQYVRPVSQAFLPMFALLPFLSGLRLSRAATVSATIAATFVLVLAPIAAFNLSTHGDLSLSTSSYGGWSVFVGANQVHNGMFNRDDQAILRATDGSVWERSKILGREGVERITGDPRGFAELAVRKFRILWSDDTYAVNAALPGLAPMDLTRHGLLLASQAVYAGLSVAATVGLWRQRQGRLAAAVLLAGLLVTIAVAHTFVEVQPRYHAYVLPLLCALAAPALASARVASRPGRAAPSPVPSS